MIRSIPSRVSPRLLQGGGAAGGGGPLSTTNGVLKKTPYGYAARDSANITGLNYSVDWSLDIAMDQPYGGYWGYLGEVARHGRDACSYDSTRPGWTLCYGNNTGYGKIGANSLTFSLTDGLGQSLFVYLPESSGKAFYSFTYTASTKTLRTYVNGTLYNTTTNAAFTNFSTIGYPLSIGGFNNTTCGVSDLASQYAFNTTQIALPEFTLHIFRFWQKVLSGTECSDLYNHWSGKGQITIPGTVSGTPATGFNFKDEVGTVTGGAGTGWIMDIYGGNHLKMVSTNAYTGAAGPAPSLSVPSGALRISNIANGATGVSGGIEVICTGLTGTGNAQQYWCEIDEVSSFDSSELRQSGWLLSDGAWTPRLKPSTTYKARVKGRNGDTLTESAWSSIVTFTTRAAVTWWARPNNWYGGTYGTESGADYANAFNGLRWQGVQGGRQAKSLQGECDGRKLAPGDTVTLCDNFGPFDTAAPNTPSAGNAPNHVYFVAQGLPTHPITLKMDDPTHPFTMYNLRHPTGWTWTSEGSGIYSSTSYAGDITYMMFDETNSGFPTVGSSLENKTYTNQGTASLVGPGFGISGGKIYVRLPDNSNPGNRVYYNESYASVSPLGKYLKFQGGSFFGNRIYHNAVTTDVTMSGLKLKYCGYCFEGQKYVDRWTIEDCELSWASAGIYGLNNNVLEEPRNCGNDWIIRRNWIHHIGYASFTDNDSHAVGIQSGLNWLVEDNLCEYTGSALEQWSTTHPSSGLILRRNVIRKTRAIAGHNPFASGLTLSNGSHDVGTRTGFQLLHNVVFDTDGSSWHNSNSDKVTAKYNLFLRPGLNPADNDYTCCMGNGASAARPQNLDFQFNVCVEPPASTPYPGWFIKGGGNGVGQDVTINNNLYWANGFNASSASRFSYPGIGSGSFTTWKALGVADQNSYFEDPLTSAHVPVGFDDLMIKMFCRSILGDVDGSGTGPNASDLTYFDNYAAGNGARVAARKLLQNLITYGAY
jgi:hypothetical protein